MVRSFTLRNLLRLAVMAVVLPAVALAGGEGETIWQELEPGLEVGRFASPSRRPTPDGDLTVLRIDPARFALKLLTTEKEDNSLGRDVAQWCEQEDLLAAVNAGMYQADRLTHVGYCKVNGEVVNGFSNDYLSLAAFGPLDPADPPFRIFDLDEVALEDVAARYANVVQNLRLVKRPAENRWQPGGDRWREAALAEDGEGRALLVYCRTSWSMQEFNAILLDLPLDVVAAQHLEGRSQARFHIRHPAYESGPGDIAPGPILPNVLGVVRREKP